MIFRTLTLQVNSWWGGPKLCLFENLGSNNPTPGSDRTPELYNKFYFQSFFSEAW